MEWKDAALRVLQWGPYAGMSLRATGDIDNGLLWLDYTLGLMDDNDRFKPEDREFIAVFLEDPTMRREILRLLGLEHGRDI